ncbi:pyrimidine 5'-nucleotidase [Niveispirillum fermenti]|uniref:pyrimidine 5'-nucleotidase n=1 Tax=Niveispirillum fermenti TaxID=1233113 RepID=UPI003A863212
MMKVDHQTIPPPAGSPVADPFAHVDQWVFDLDNTLYPARCNLFAQVDVRITDYIARELALDREAARARQKDYYLRHGTSLRGMMIHHGMDPAAFLDYVHDIDVTPVAPSPAMAAALRALPGRKLVFTNGSVRHAENVLTRLGVADQFDGIFDIVAADYVPKPDPATYAAMARRFALEPSRAVMVEDLHRNLGPAAEMGMTTVWVRTESEFSHPEMKGEFKPQAIQHPGPHVHHVIDDVETWLEGLAARRR